MLGKIKVTYKILVFWVMRARKCPIEATREEGWVGIKRRKKN
jgi:hypothetical protein